MIASMVASPLVSTIVLAHGGDHQAGNRGQDDHRLLVQADDVKGFFGSDCNKNAQHGPAAQQDNHQQGQELRHRAGENDGSESITPERVVQPVENPERDVGKQGFGTVACCSEFDHSALFISCQPPPPWGTARFG